MTSNKYRKTNLGFAFHVQSLYGRYMYSLHKDWQSLNSLKEILRRLLKTYSAACIATIEEADESFYDELQAIFEKSDERIKMSSSMDDIDQVFITIQSEILFQILGGPQPNNWSKEKVSNHKRNWKKNSFRTLSYRQNMEQKAWSIIFHSKKYQTEFNLPTEDDLKRTLWLSFKNDHSSFVDWFKTDFPEVYVRIV